MSTTLKGRPAILTVGFPPTETRDRVTILSWPSDSTEPCTLVKDDNGNVLLVHKSRVRLTK